MTTSLNHKLVAVAATIALAGLPAASASANGRTRPSVPGVKRSSPDRHRAKAAGHKISTPDRHRAQPGNRAV